MSPSKWEIQILEDEVITEVVAAAAKLFSENYGVWGPLAAERIGGYAKQGSRVKMSPKKLINATFPSDTTAKNMYVRATSNQELIGNVFGTSWTHEGRRMLWVTQLCVGKDHRHQGVANALLKALARSERYFAIGILSSHPFPISAVLRVFAQGVEMANLNFQQENAHSVMESCPVEYIRSAVILNQKATFADTGFWVDHTESEEALALLKGKNTWPLGDLSDGCEFLALVEGS